ncbi:MAG: hypothetical protein JWP97_3879 [Labilithrix sp.]|nr:hypothetical protein [Labilithrix sp.]
MRRLLARTLHVSVLVTLGVAACSDVPVDDTRNDRRLFPARGVIRGTVTYTGPRPCSRDGHIVGNAIILVFDRKNPPPPVGIATGAENFVAVQGDVLFANEPRSTSKELYCPPSTDRVTVSAPFVVAPLAGGSYQLSSFYDRRGRFWPTFKFRNQPEAGDIAGGFLDVADAARHAGDVGYQPIYLPVNVGREQPGTPPGQIPDYLVDDSGYVADNVPVTIGAVVPFTRPYFHPLDQEGQGAEVIGDARTSGANPSGDPLAVPIVVMTQDAKILAAPSNPTAQTLAAYQNSFRQLRLAWGVAREEVVTATDPAQPFDLQLPALPPSGKGGLLVWSRGAPIAENAAVPDLWPQVAFVKLADDPFRKGDPQSLVVQGTAEETLVTGKPPGPMVVIQGITLLDDSLARTVAGPLPAAPATGALRDHLTVMVRPAALCFDPRAVDAGGLLVTPHLTGQSADATETGEKPLFDQGRVLAQAIVRDVQRGCLPKGRYAISLVYPTGQTWTVPNEMGGCAPSEGTVTGSSTCSQKTRPVLLSQGARAVLEVVEPRPEDQSTCQSFPVPDACTKL